MNRCNREASVETLSPLKPVEMASNNRLNTVELAPPAGIEPAT